MDCPRCSGEMRKGFVTAAGYRVVWTAKERKRTDILGREDVLLNEPGLSVKGIPAHICKNCRTVVLEY